MAILEMQSSAALSLLLILLLTTPYIFYHLTRTLTKKKPTTHGLKSHPLLGHLPVFLRNRHRFLDWSTELIVANPDQRIGFWIPGMRTGIVTANPADVDRVLRANFANYPKGEHATSMLRDFLSCGLFNSDGDQCLWQRKNASLHTPLASSLLFPTLCAAFPGRASFATPAPRQEPRTASPATAPVTPAMGLPLSATKTRPRALALAPTNPSRGLTDACHAPPIRSHPILALDVRARRNP
ncbi:cytochrome P450 94B3-like [Panicum miliaceum]|uniref:Cytochrome P450 94B3-like n=1 Tax=Panicum miliaceum TaxID=4540 RepID=A0A3L6Q1U0_PANMI|nr:cytochrome P450 94B3-like [Panicum miliaceum]